jgi:hypothetical protein
MLRIPSPFCGGWARAAALIGICSSLLAALPDHSVSPSQQFIIYGGDPAFRGALSQLAEQTKSNLLSLLRQPDNWKIVILINLQTPQANLPEVPPTEIRISQTGFGVKLQVDFTVGPKVDAALFERELLRAILLEMIYRRQPNIPPGAVYIQPPNWLVDGVLALSPGREPRDLIEALAVSPKTQPLEDFLRPQPITNLDSAARTLFRAYSYALVQMLIDLPDGRSQLARYIDNLSSVPSEPLAGLQAKFSALRNDSIKRWQSTVAEIEATAKYELLSFAETASRLDRLLILRLGESPVKIADPGELLLHGRLAAEKAALVRLSGELLLLAARAHPVMRPIVREYQEIVSLMAVRKSRHLARRLTDVQVLRARLVEHMTNIDDYMNWFEATQLTNKSGTFGEYLRAADSEEVRFRRRDPLSVYLDSLENQF